MDAHSTKRAPSVVTTGLHTHFIFTIMLSIHLLLLNMYNFPNVGSGCPRSRLVEQQTMGWGEMHNTDLQFHTWLLLSNSLQADPIWIRVGEEQHRCCKQPTWLPSDILRESPNALERPFSRFLHGNISLQHDFFIF